MSNVTVFDKAPEQVLANMVVKQKYITLATAFNKLPVMPETATVAYAFGKANYHYAIFWLSSPQSNHSQHIIDNPNISGEIIDQTMPQGTGFKIKFRGPAYAMDDLSDQRLHRGYEFLKDKLTQFPQTLGDLVKNDSLKKIYMMRVEDVTVNAAIEYEGQIGWKDISLNHDAPTSNVLHLAHEMNFHVD